MTSEQALSAGPSGEAPEGPGGAPARLRLAGSPVADTLGPGIAGRPVEQPGGQERGRVAREEILSAAIACLLEDGYAATTTMRVQERAGVSRGKLLHHFPSKRALITASISRLAADRLDTRTSDYSAAPPESDVPARVRWAIGTIWLTFFHPNFWAALETWIAARTDPELAAELIDHEKQVLARVRENTHLIFGETVCADPAFPAMLDVVFTSMRGMALTYTFSGRDPDTEPMIETWVRTALALLEHEQ